MSVDSGPDIMPGTGDAKIRQFLGPRQYIAHCTAEGQSETQMEGFIKA